MPSGFPDYWKISTLGEVCQINPSRTEVAGLPDSMDVSFVPMAAVSEEGMLLEAKTRKVKEVKKSFPHFKERDVLVAKITPCFENGKRWLASSLVNGVGFGSTEFHVLRASKDVLPEWIYYFISSPTLRKDGKGRMTGTAGQKRVPASFLEQYKIPVPPITVQERIVRALRRADKLREVREQANHLTNKIIQSVFLKMFGDPAINPKGWTKATVESVCTDVIDCPHSTPTYTEAGVPLIRTPSIKRGYIDLTETKFISPEEHKARSRRINSLPGDILYAREATFGNAGLVRKGQDFSVGQRIMLLRPNPNLVTSEFLVWMINSEYVYSQAARVARGATNPHVNVADVREFTIIVPPIENQMKFASAATVVESMRERQYESTGEINELFRSLMQKAFRGELVKANNSGEL